MNDNFKDHEAAIAAAMRCLDEFMAAFNARDVEAFEKTFNFPSVRIASNKLAVIDFILSHTLRLFHPFLPFITEELWHGMGYAEDMPQNQGGKTIMFAPWPKPLDEDFVAHEVVVGFGPTGRCVFDADKRESIDLLQAFDERLRECAFSRPLRGVDLHQIFFRAM